MNLFIPLLFVCINSNCEFMQSTDIFVEESDCRAAVDKQKKRIEGLVKQTNKAKIKTLQGTCVDLDTSNLRKYRGVQTKSYPLATGI